nr:MULTISPECIES: hypothetical protein [Flavobacterium]
MSRMIYDYTKMVLERVSLDPKLFAKEIKIAAKNLLPFELENLKKWLFFYTKDKPELRIYFLYIKFNKSKIKN